MQGKTSSLHTFVHISLAKRRENNSIEICRKLHRNTCGISPHNGNFFKLINNSHIFTSIPSEYVCAFVMRNSLVKTITGFLRRVNLICFQGYYNYTVKYRCLPRQNRNFLFSIRTPTLVAYIHIIFCKYGKVKNI